MKQATILPFLIIILFIACTHITAEEYFNRAKIETKADKKIELLSKAIELKPDYFDAISERAKEEGDAAIAVKRLIAGHMAPIGEDIKHYNNCLKDYETAFKINPNDAPSYFHKGITEHWMGDTVQSCSDLNKAMSLGYNCKDALRDFCK
ncbi:MAG TPA: hypothetical protein VK783_13720 [Bacteroidia bacterium]|jgi:hypothetical protein|nr:hypothetical protein [Bacteroidia bacterium]